MCLNLLKHNRRKEPQKSDLPLFEASGQSLMSSYANYEEKPSVPQANNQLELEKLELEKINEMLRKQLAEKEAHITELEAVSYKDSRPITPIRIDNSRKEESDKEKRLVNSLLDILTLLDFNELDSNCHPKELKDNIRRVISEALSYHNISLYRDEAVLFNPKWHQLITWETTEDPSLDDFIKEALSTGVKMDENRCLRPEKVSVYKYK